MRALPEETEGLGKGAPVGAFKKKNGCKDILVLKNWSRE